MSFWVFLAQQNKPEKKNNETGIPKPTIGYQSLL